MADLDTLRPEVRSALGAMVRADVCRDSVPTEAFDTIRAELLRLAGECAMIPRAQLLANFAAANERAERAEAERDELRTAYTSASQSRDYWKECTERAEAELAALKARIAEAPVATLVYGQSDMLAVVSAENADDWAGKTVRLLVENDDGRG